MAKMLRVPDITLKKLTCACCGGYLSTQPIMVNRTHEQYCGKCFETLPKGKRAEFARQVGLEALASVFIFPCRYHVRGCNHAFPWNKENNHEADCPYKYIPLAVEAELPLMCHYNSVENCVYQWESDQLTVQAQCDLVNLVDENNNRLKFRVDILPTSVISKLDTNELTIAIEGLVDLGDRPKFRYCRANLIGSRIENIYESVICTDVCNNCKAPVYYEIYHCLFGHNACKNCKGNKCPLCFTDISKEARTYCKNHLRGCRTLFLHEDVKRHEIDCEYSDMRCPVPGCPFSCILSGLLQHLQEIHPDDLYISREMTRNLTDKDKYWFCYCYDKLFICKYYYLYDTVEFLVEFLGRNDEARDYKYEVSVTSGKFEEDKTKHGKCLGWNEVALGKAVTFRIKECTGRMRFDVGLYISH